MHRPTSHFYADFHIHSKYSRATSPKCDLENLALWGRKKGLSVIGTGDFTHPVWFAEIQEKLVPAEPGLFRLKPDLEKAVMQEMPASVRGPMRFMLSVEISSIYKKNEKVRKNHNLVLAPDLDQARKIIQKLSRIGNLKSDGRPILGLPSRDLLEIVLEAGEGSYVIPAHVWTPWFSLFGSKSGYDSVEECFEDLSGHIFALETGLSSDPYMNRRVSALDGYRLVSNSDAHSPQKLGREACIFSTSPDFFAMKMALETGNYYEGTLEFFPEEGKYHEDGHRKCDVSLPPWESKELDGICPQCGRPLTIGVLARVEDLADRPPDYRAKGDAPHDYLIPLPEIIGELMGRGPATKGVSGVFETLIAKLGSEFRILRDLPNEAIKAAGGELLAEAIHRLRQGHVIRKAGFDGEYGVIRVFEKDELSTLRHGETLFDVAPASPRKKSRSKPVTKTKKKATDSSRKSPSAFKSVARAKKNEFVPSDPLAILDPDQRAAATHGEGPLLILAGPGSGKTRTLTHRMAHLMRCRRARGDQCLALTFTRRAAEEMRLRLVQLLGEKHEVSGVHTFHSLAFQLLKEFGSVLGLPKEITVHTEDSKKPQSKGELSYDDLLDRTLELFTGHADIVQMLRSRWPWVSVDEFQDLDERQHSLVRHLAPPGANLCVVGDPNQSIYSFRGADLKHFLKFRQDYPDAKVYTLCHNYRSSEAIVAGSGQVIERSSISLNSLGASRQRSSKPDPSAPEISRRVIIHRAPTDKAEAEFVVQSVEKMIGGSSFFSLDSGRVESNEGEGLAFSDFAVLYRTDAQRPLLEEAFVRSGMPFQSVSRRTGDEDDWDPRADRISLLTLHAAKGLEFPVVFITGCEDGLLPLKFGSKQAGDPEEERRLFYVGMTRARQSLFLTHAGKRLWRGKVQQQVPSPFIGDIQKWVLEVAKSVGKKRRPSEGSQTMMFDSEVQHEDR